MSRMIFSARPLRAALAGALALSLSAGALAQDAGPKPPTVSTVTAAKRDIISRVTVTGSIVAREEVLVSPEIENLRIVEILVEEGDRVEKGQVLARLSRDTLQAELARLEAAQSRLNAGINQADASRAEAEAALKRSQALRQTGNASQEQLDQRTATARTTQAGLRIAEAQRIENEAQIREVRIRLGRTDVKAPAAGVVSKRTAKLGAQTSNGADPLFRIIADGALDVAGDVPEARFLQLRVGQRADIELPDGQRIAGQVRLLSPTVNATTRLGAVRIALPSGAPALLGNFARGTVITAEKSALVAPAAALQFGPKVTVQIAKDGKIETRTVQTGIRGGGLIEILSGLAEGDEIIAKAGTFLRQGDRVRPQPVALETVLNAGSIGE